MRINLVFQRVFSYLVWHLTMQKTALKDSLVAGVAHLKDLTFVPHIFYIVKIYPEINSNSKLILVY